jgi:hypothetical protein
MMVFNYDFLPQLWYLITILIATCDKYITLYLMEGEWSNKVGSTQSNQIPPNIWPDYLTHQILSKTN